VLELKVHDGERDVVLKFEHSLLSLSKWESKHKIPFMARRIKSNEELLDYFQDMLLTPEDPRLIYMLDPGQLDALGSYINDPMTASSVPNEETRRFEAETITSELIYYWLVALEIPFTPTETWHVNRIVMLVQITSFKKQPPKKRPAGDVMARWRDLNEQRKKMFNTNG
jgi:hypothetical protein